MRIGAYDLLEKLGQGGVGIVYKARHSRSGQVVAVKVVRTERMGNPVLLKRFEQEFLAVTRLRHPAIVQGWDFGIQEDLAYLVMEFIDGPTLRVEVRDRGPVRQGQAVGWLVQIAEGLSVAHEHRLVHRDIKPSNILLAPDGTARLTDLGLMKDMESDASLTQSGMSLGTIQFMAPEQYGDAKHVDVRCDVYGLGATLYYAVTGVSPFPGRGNLSVLAKKLKNEFAPAGEIVPGLDPRIDALIARCLDPRVDRRPASCAEFIEALRDLPADAAVLAGAGSGVAGENGGLGECERRGATRYETDLSGSCWTLQDRRTTWSARVQDVSMTGVQLHLDRRFEPGTVLALEVLDDRSEVLTMKWLRVCWVRDLPSNEWSLGCTFTHALDQGELSTFLENESTTVVVHEQGESPSAPAAS